MDVPGERGTEQVSGGWGSGGRGGLTGDWPLTPFSGPGACCSQSRRPWRKGEGLIPGVKKGLQAWGTPSHTPSCRLLCPYRSLTIRPAVELQVWIGRG